MKIESQSSIKEDAIPIHLFHIYKYSVYRLTGNDMRQSFSHQSNDHLSGKNCNVNPLTSTNDSFSIPPLLFLSPSLSLSYNTIFFSLPPSLSLSLCINIFLFLFQYISLFHENFFSPTNYHHISISFRNFFNWKID